MIKEISLKDVPREWYHYKANYQHIYNVSGFSTMSSKTHYCLEDGKFCFSNFIQNPFKIIKYIKKRI